MLTGQPNHFTGVAQRKRARLITLRTPDRNGSPVLLQFTSFTEAGRHSSRDVKHEHPFTGMAQRQRAGLIILRSLDRDELPVLFQFGCFTEATRLASDVKCSQNTLYRDGAGEARGAHNPEVTGSNPVPGILHFARFIETRGHSSSDLKHEHQYCRCSSAEERLKPRPSPS